MREEKERDWKKRLYILIHIHFMAPFPCFLKKGISHFHFELSLPNYVGGPVPLPTLNYAQMSAFLSPFLVLVSLYVSEDMAATLKIQPSFKMNL